MSSDLALETSLKSWTFHAAAALILYPVLVSVLRCRRIKRLEAKYRAILWEGLAKMTDNEAFDVVNNMAELEFPTLYEKALQFALFRTYGIPTISSLLVQTTQLSTAKSAGKRYADTGVLIAEIWGNEPSDMRSIEAFARLNYLHGHYIKQDLISNDDLLYTLALFMLEPLKWIAKYEWRRPSEIERCASGVLHKTIGDAMEINFDNLPSGRTGFKDGLHFLEEVEAWADAYEVKCMVPNKNNHQTANETTKLLLMMLPESLQDVGFNVVKALMDTRLRKAMMYDDPPASYISVVEAVFTVRKYVLRYLVLPRPAFMRVRIVIDTPDAQGRRGLTRYDNFPYYVRPTWANRWGPGAWISWARGLPIPGDEGYVPEGFQTMNVGPRAFEGKGRMQAEKTKEKLLQTRTRTGGCPFASRTS